MSDRTQSSVRTGSRGEGDAAGGSTPEAASLSPPRSPSRVPARLAARARRLPPPGRQPAASGPVPPATGSGPAVTAPATAATAGTSDASGQGTVRGRVRGGKSGGRGPRRARLQLRHVDIWSAFKISFVLAIAMFFIWMVAIGVLYGVLSALGVFDTLNELFGQLGSASGSDVGGDVVTPGLVFGGAAVIGAINIVLMTALCTVGTFIYNLCADLVGGLELTLSERD